MAPWTADPPPASLPPWRPPGEPGSHHVAHGEVPTATPFTRRRARNPPKAPRRGTPRRPRDGPGLVHAFGTVGGPGVRIAKTSKITFSMIRMLPPMTVIHQKRSGMLLMYLPPRAKKTAAKLRKCIVLICLPVKARRSSAWRWAVPHVPDDITRAMRVCNQNALPGQHTYRSAGNRRAIDHQQARL